MCCSDENEWKTYAAPRVWLSLHDLAYVTPERLTQAYVVKVINAYVRCVECRRTALAYVAANPIPDDPTLRLAWTVDWHDSVNRELGRPEMGAEAARAIYERRHAERVAGRLSRAYFSPNHASWPKAIKLS